MKTFSEFLAEGLLDDILSDFDDVDSDFITPKMTKNLVKRKRFKPRVFKGVKPDSSFVKYIRSERELKSKLKGKITLRGIIDLYALENIAISDAVTVNLTVKELDTVKEYDRAIIDGSTGSNSEQELKDLVKSIKQNGINNYGVIDFYRHGRNVSVILGEGNHRLKIAKELKIKTMPIKFNYRSE